ncbi:TPA: hypothetical protein ACXIWR_004859, partial [Enterobacter mori]
MYQQLAAFLSGGATLTRPTKPVGPCKRSAAGRNAQSACINNSAAFLSGGAALTRPTKPVGPCKRSAAGRNAQGERYQKFSRHLVGWRYA